MKRTISLLLFCLTLLTGVKAQVHTLTGSVVNEKSREAVVYATVRLMKGDTTLVTGANTDEKGRFTLTTREQGKLSLRVSYISLGTKILPVELGTTTDTLRLGDIALSSTEVELGAAIVKAAAARVEQKEDTTVFNASAYRTPAGSTVEALVKQLPGVQISDDGTITWNGKTVTEFLINGKDFFKGDTKVAMKNLPTDLISKIKAYDKKSDYTEQTGIDDGEETTVLDLTTKRELNESWITNADLAYGTKDRYSGRVFISRFTDNSNITAFGSMNNVNDMGFGGPRGFRGASGLTASKMAGLDFNWENGKKKFEAGRFEIGGNVNYNHTSTDALSTTASETFLTSGSTSSFSNSRSHSFSSSTSVQADMNLKWSPDSMTNIVFRPSFSHSDSHNSGVSRTATFNDDPYSIDGMVSPLDSIYADVVNEQLKNITVNTNERFTLGDSKSNSVSGSLNIVRRLGKTGRNVSLRANGSWGKSESHNYTISHINYYQAQSSDNKSYLNQYSLNPSKNWNYGVRLGYTEPIANNWFAEARYEYNYKFTDSNRSLYNLDAIKENDSRPSWWDAENFPKIGTIPTEQALLDSIRDLNNSQYATYKDYSQKVNIGVRYNKEEIRFNAGVDFNPEKTKMEYNRPGQIDTVITRKVFNVSPSVRFRYRFSKTNMFELFYRGSSSQPSMTNLLDVVDDSDPLNISMGNPGLKPSWTNNLRAFYRGYDAESQRGIMGGIDFSQTSNSVNNLMVYDETEGVRYTRPENIDGNWNANGHFMFNTALGKEKLYNITSFTRLGYDNSVGYVSRLDASATNANRKLRAALSSGDYDAIFDNANPSKSTTRSLTVGENLNISYRTSWFDVGLLGSVDYQHARSTLQSNANMDTWNYAYGANANFTFNWGMSVSTDIRMNSRRGYADQSMNTNELLWNAQISQSFLKGNAATLSVQFYDLLHQQSNVSRTISALARSDSWNNAINSYVMVHFIYRLNIFGGKRTSDEDRDKDEFRGRGPGRGMPSGPMRMGPPMGR